MPTSKGFEGRWYRPDTSGSDEYQGECGQNVVSPPAALRIQGDGRSGPYALWFTFTTVVLRTPPPCELGSGQRQPVVFGELLDDVNHRRFLVLCGYANQSDRCVEGVLPVVVFAPPRHLIE